MINNPFSKMSQSGSDELYGISTSELEEFAKFLSDGKSIVALSGGYGSGRSTIASEIVKLIPADIKVQKLVLSHDLPDILRSIPIEKSLHPKMVLEIDRFEYLDAFDDKKIEKIADLMIYIISMGVGILLIMNDKALERLLKVKPEIKSAMKIYVRKPLLFTDFVQMVLSKLNAVREKSSSLEPFSETQLKKVWSNSNGNPKLALMILETLHDLASMGKK